jgi:SAM-dependent methyltransferase
LSRSHSGAIGALHDNIVHGRRTRVLSDWFSKIAPQGSRILDVGCGDGLIAALLQSKRPDVSVQGIDVLLREKSNIPVTMFDGSHIPFPDDSFDVVMFSDVLHHTEDPEILLREAGRVGKRVMIKDHYREGIVARQRLRFMDWVGNARFGVALPYNYWSRRQWSLAWSQIGLESEQMVTKLGLYPKPADWIFGAQLHFITLLKRSAPHPAD